MSDYIPVEETDILPNDTASFNLFASNLIKEYNLCIFRLRDALSRNGMLIEGNLRTFSDDTSHPLVKLHLYLQEEGSAIDGSTSLLTEKSNGCSFIFVGGNRWRRTRMGGKYTLAPNLESPDESIVICSTPPEYYRVTTDGGTGSIYTAIQGLRSRNPQHWKVHFHTLCLLFLEPARLHFCQEEVARSLLPRKDVDIYHSRVPLSENYFQYVLSWGKFCDILLRGRAAFEADRAASADLPEVMKLWNFKSFDDLVGVVAIVRR